MKSSSGKRLELLEAVKYVDMFVLVVGRHVAQLHKVSVTDAEREDIDRVLTKSPRYRARVAAVGVTVCDEEQNLLSVRTSRSQHFLFDNNNTHCQP